MPVIATAGHVDHGKSTLVRALTGRDPDRWEEEQRRGMTIDLGFAWTSLGEHEVGFIDVPGHERFIKNMLAGVDGIDAALFVVAADEGWMPQSEEHLAVLDLLEVRHGVVALTRVDLVEPEAAALAALEVADRLAGTSLEGVEVIPVSAPAGIGLDRLRSALAAAVHPSSDRGRPRLWVDRSFTIGGAGTVVTGTLLGGSVAVGDTLTVHPSGTTVRVRALQTHEHAVDRIAPGNRAAVNLGGVDRETIGRGDMLGLPGQWRTTTRLLADVRLVRTSAGALRPGGSYHAHLGSGSHPARLGVVDGVVVEGRGPVLLTLESPVVAAAGDPVILREVGRRAVVAGGVVLDPHPVGRRGAVAATVRLLAAAHDPDARAAALLEVRGVAPGAQLAADTDGGTAVAALDHEGEMVSPGAAARLEEAARNVVSGFHDSNPLRPGIPLPALATAIGTTPGLTGALVGASTLLVVDGPVVRLASFAPRLEPAAAQAWETARTVLAAAGFSPPGRADLGLAPEVVHALIRSGSVVAVGDDFVYLPDTVVRLEAATRALPDGFSVAEFRDALGITRKHAIPLLEWMDRTGITRRTGDTRSIRQR